MTLASFLQKFTVHVKIKAAGDQKCNNSLYTVHLNVDFLTVCITIAYSPPNLHALFIGDATKSLFIQWLRIKLKVMASRKYTGLFGLLNIQCNL